MNPEKPYSYHIYIDRKLPTVDKKVEKPWRLLISSLVDMYSHPDIIELQFPPHGKQQRLENAKRIRSYFTKSLGGF